MALLDLPSCECALLIHTHTHAQSNAQAQAFSQHIVRFSIGKCATWLKWLFAAHYFRYKYWRWLKKVFRCTEYVESGTYNFHNKSPIKSSIKPGFTDYLPTTKRIHRDFLWFCAVWKFEKYFLVFFSSFFFQNNQQCMCLFWSFPNSIDWRFKKKDYQEHGITSCGECSSIFSSTHIYLKGIDNQKNRKKKTKERKEVGAFEDQIKFEIMSKVNKGACHIFIGPF